MSLQAYLDNIKTQTGMTPEDFRIEAEKKGLLKDGVKTGEIVAWLKKDYGLGHGHAMAIVLMLQNATRPPVSKQEKIADLFKGDKSRWRAPYDELVSKMGKFGPGVAEDPTNTYISILRQGKKFAIIQVTADRLDIGIKRKNAETTDRFLAAGKWNSMVTHRVTINKPNEIDGEVISWLKKAYEAVQPDQTPVP